MPFAFEPPPPPLRAMSELTVEVDTSPWKGSRNQAEISKSVDDLQRVPLSKPRRKQHEREIWPKQSNQLTHRLLAVIIVGLGGGGSGGGCGAISRWPAIPEAKESVRGRGGERGGGGSHQPLTLSSRRGETSAKTAILIKRPD